MSLLHLFLIQLSTIGIVLAVAFFCFLTLFILNLFDKKKPAAFYSIYTPQGLQVIKILEEYFENNKPLPIFGYWRIYDDLFGKLDAQGDIYAYEKALGIYNWQDEPEISLKFIAGDYLMFLEFDLDARYRNQYQKLKCYNEVEAQTEFGINIQTDETVHERFTRVDWFEEKRVIESIAYAGVKFHSGQGGIRYTMGTLRSMPQYRDRFEHVDRGDLYITNKRILFVGKEKEENRSVKMDNIIEFSLFKGGILIGKESGKKPYIEFGQWLKKPNKAPNKRDDLNQATRAIQRVLSNNQNQDLEDRSRFDLKN
jgi:hypothetical protein